MPRGWHNATVGLPPGISEASVRIAASESPIWVMYSLGLDIGEVALGYHLIARSIFLWAEDLLFEYAFLPELTWGQRGWLNPATVCPARRAVS